MNRFFENVLSTVRAGQFDFDEGESDDQREKNMCASLYLFVSLRRLKENLDQRIVSDETRQLKVGGQGEGVEW